MLWGLSDHSSPGLWLTLSSGPLSLSLEKPSSASLQLRLVSWLVDWPSVFMNGLIVGARSVLHTSGSSAFNTTVTVPTKTSLLMGKEGGHIGVSPRDVRKWPPACRVPGTDLVWPSPTPPAFAPLSFPHTHMPLTFWGHYPPHPLLLPSHMS